MALDRKQLIRIAQKTRDQLRVMERNKRSLVPQKLQRFIEQMDSLKNIQYRLETSLDRGWDKAAGQVVRSVDSALRDVRYHTEEVESALKRWPGNVPPLRNILEDLIQADDEFGTLKYDPEEHSISIVTDPITLEEVYLGPFEIRVHINGLAEAHYGRGYDILALDPHPASSNESVTHPHVNDDQLCAGDAATPIRMALTEGRLCDVFQLIHGVLTTYNPNSPYVPLDHWDGVSCYECGFVMPPDETHWCDFCRADFCSECATYCSRCDEPVCLCCIRECPICEEAVCPACMTACGHCEQTLCEHCLCDEKCPCQNEEDDDECEQNDGKADGEANDGEAGQSGAESTTTTAPATAGVAVHADGVGQVVVLQGQRPD